MDQKAGKLTPVMDGFAKDESGKIFAMPVKLPVVLKTNSSGKRIIVRRRSYIHIEPLNFGASPHIDGKRRKIDKPSKLPTVRTSTIRHFDNKSKRNGLKNVRDKIRGQNEKCSIKILINDEEGDDNSTNEKTKTTVNNDILSILTECRKEGEVLKQLMQAQENRLVRIEKLVNDYIK